MKYFPVLLIILFSVHKISCQNLTDIKLEWLQSKVEKDRLYEAKNDCDALMKYFSEEVIFYEKGDLLTYKWLEEYCPLLPKNLPKPDKIKKKEFLLSLTTAYDILEETFYTEEQVTYKKVTTSIWQKMDSEWKIVHMNVGMHKEEDGPEP